MQKRMTEVVAYILSKNDKEQMQAAVEKVNSRLLEEVNSRLLSRH